MTEDPRFEDDCEPRQVEAARRVIVDVLRRMVQRDKREGDEVDCGTFHSCSP